MSPELVDSMELELAGKCDRVFATAESLAKRLETVNDHTAFIPNGANFERFVQASWNLPCPKDMQEISKPIFGFVGALQACIEYGFVKAAAQAHPEWSFVFIGREKPGVDLSELRAMENCHFLGLKPNESLPDYICQFDACLNLFDSSPLSKDVSPLKFYEYLATGKPVISTPQPDQILQFASIIQIAHNAQEFIKCCQDALQDKNAAARIEEGRKSSWDARVTQMLEILEHDGVF